jgi:hypothetical protein
MPFTPGIPDQTPKGTPGWRIFLFLEDFVNTPGKVINPSGTLRVFFPQARPWGFQKTLGKTSQHFIIIFSLKKGLEMNRCEQRLQILNQ